MRLRRNLLAGLAHSIWTALIGLAVVPLYLRYLGLEAYGLIGFFATAQAILLLLDLGLTPTINREVARASATGRLDGARQLLHTLAFVYWGTAVLLAAAVALPSAFIANYWLRASHLSADTLTHAVMLMGLVIACRWPIALYQGVLMGMQRMTASSAIGIAMVSLASLGGVAVLAFVSRSIEALFLWQAGVAVLHVAALRWAAWRALGGDHETRLALRPLLKVWRFSAGMGGVAAASILLAQLDKVLLSRMLGLEDFGRYTLAGVLAGALAIIVVPVFNVVYPHYATMVARGEPSALETTYLLGTRMFCVVLFPIAIGAAIYSQDLLQVWTGDAALAASVAPIAALLVLGSALNGVMHFPYALQLASGMVSLPLALSAGLAVAFVPIIIFLTSSFGARGGAAAWLVLNVIYLFVGAWLTHRRLLVGLAPRWLLRSVLLPLGIALAAALAGSHWIGTETGWNSYARLAAAAAVGLLTMAAQGALSIRNGSWSKRWNAGKIGVSR